MFHRHRLLCCDRAGSDADTDGVEGAPLLRPHIMSAEAAAGIGPELRLDIGICSVDRDDGDDVLEVPERCVMCHLLLVPVLLPVLARVCDCASIGARHIEHALCMAGSLSSCTHVVHHPSTVAAVDIVQTRFQLHTSDSLQM